jgi:pimeloyl-ACP methyl ester carboxylesterase
MMLDGVGNRFIFPAPDPSYGAQSYKRNLCWIPWNSVISPKRAGDEKSGDGIPCLWFPAPKAATVILFFHANAEDLGMSFAVLKHIRDQFKVNVLAVEYPGYGLLHHMSPSEDAVYEVALTAFRFLVDEINVRYSQIILFGRSLGSGPAVFLAAQYPVGGLILVSAFSSIRAAVQSIVGRVFAWTFAERFPNSKIIANVSCSTLFIHGECDGLIPAEHSLRLFQRCRARKLLITPPRMEHNSNLFGDASFLAVPAIHFFGFPGYYTSTPPRLPAHLFESPERRLRMKEQQTTKRDVPVVKPWLCDCLGKSDPHHLDVSFCRQEHSVEEITIRFFDNGGEAAKHGATNGKPMRLRDEALDGPESEAADPDQRKSPCGLDPVGPFLEKPQGLQRGKEAMLASAGSRSPDHGDHIVDERLLSSPQPRAPKTQDELQEPCRGDGGKLPSEGSSSFTLDHVAPNGGDGGGGPGASSARARCLRESPSRLRKDGEFDIAAKTPADGKDADDWDRDINADELGRDAKSAQRAPPAGGPMSSSPMTPARGDPNELELGAL